MNDQPTNLDLQKTIELQSQQFADHASEDVVQFAAVRNDVRKEFDSVHARLDSVATKDDMQQLKDTLDPLIDAYKTVMFSKNFFVGLGAVAMSLTAIGLSISWFIGSFKH